MIRLSMIVLFILYSLVSRKTDQQNTDGQLGFIANRCWDWGATVALIVGLWQGHYRWNLLAIFVGIPLVLYGISLVLFSQSRTKSSQ